MCIVNIICSLPKPLTSENLKVITIVSVIVLVDLIRMLNQEVVINAFTLYRR